MMLSEKSRRSANAEQRIGPLVNAGGAFWLR